MVVTVIFWALLAGSGTFATTLSGACPRLSPIPHPACSAHRLNEYDMFSAWFNISEHATNTGYALFEITLTNVGPNSWWHLPICIVVLACYLGVAYITHATQGFYSASPPPPLPSSAALRAAQGLHIFRMDRRTHAVLSPAAYSFLDPKKEHAKLAGYIAGIGVAEAIALLLAQGLIRVRMRLSGRKSRTGGSPSINGPPAAIEEDWEEVERPGSGVGQAV